MSNHVIVASFGNAAAARQAAKEISALGKQGLAQFQLKAGGAMISKAPRTGTVTIEEKGRRGAFGLAVGAVAGGLIGMVAGPAGAAIGAALGATMGLVNDAMRESIDAGYISFVEEKMEPGSVAVIVEANEGSTRPIDDIVARGGGQVYRRSI